MSILSAISLISGISLFIFGMSLIKYSLEKNYGERMRKLSEKFTSHRFSCVLSGALVTFSLQSSSASSVITAAFVDSGYLSLYKAFWIIVGANIGTTFTGLFTALDISRIMPVLLLPGILLITVFRDERKINLGLLLSGAGMIFVGMGVMESSVSALSGNAFIKDLLSMCSSPLAGVLAGTFITALLQSSSAVTAVLQTLSSQGLCDINQAFYIILGANIGTCATCAIASWGLKSGAKKVALMHIIYNAAGAMLFLLLSLFFPFAEKTAQLFPSGIKTQIAVLNILFNIMTALPLLFIPVREKKRKIIPEKNTLGV